MENVYDQGDEVSDFLTTFLANEHRADPANTEEQSDDSVDSAPSLLQRVRLVFMNEEAKRPVKEKYALSKEDLTSFSDGFSFLLINENSLRDLNNRLIEKYNQRDGILLKMNRFRPNIVVTGLQPYEEDDLFRVKIHTGSETTPTEVNFRAVKPCPRCKVTTINQETGAVGKEPLDIFRAYRKVGDDLLFGQNLIWERSEPMKLTRIRVGDPITFEFKVEDT